MATLLQVNASIYNSNGQSSRLADQFVAAFRERYPAAKIVVRDVAAAEPVPHLNAERFGAFITKAEERSAAQHATVAYSDTLIDELKQADVIVFGLPMYNFGVPSQLKAYFDHIARAIRKDKRFWVPGFGTFSVRRRRARLGYNPNTQSPMTIPAARTVGFRPAPKLRKGL